MIFNFTLSERRILNSFENIPTFNVILLLIKSIEP